MRLRVILYIWFCCSVTLSAQDAAEVSPLGEYLKEEIPQQLFDTEQWESAKEGIDYNQDIRVDRRDENFFDEEDEDKKKTAQRRESTSSGSGLGSFLFKALLVIALIAAVAFIVANFVGGQGLKFRRNKNIDRTPINIDVETVEEKLIESDLERMIRLAEEDKNYPLALRLHYLAGVKTLALKNHIRWKKGKTNRQYSYEIENQELNKNFQELTLIYERIWYGSTVVKLEDFQHLKPQFKDFIQKVERNPARKELIAINE